MSKTGRAQIVLIVFLFQQIFFIFSVQSAEKTTLVVQSWRDGTEDEITDKTAAIFRQKLSNFSFLYIVDPKKVDAVLNYHVGYKVASDDADVREAKSWLNRAKQHYFDFAFSEAVSELKKVVQIFEADSQLPLKEGSLLLDAWLAMGLSYQALGQKEEVQECFEKILSMNPLFRPDSNSFAPSFHKIFNVVLAKQSGRVTSKIVVQSDPKVVEVSLNGIAQGVTPLTLSLPPAEYTLSFIANNYQTQNKKITLKENEVFNIRPKLHWVAIQKTDQKITRRQVEEGVRIADLLKTDKTLLVDVNQSQVLLRLLDRRFRSSLRPIVFDLKSLGEDFEVKIEKMVRLVMAQTQIDLSKKPYAHLDPEGIGDPILLQHQPKKISKGVLWGGLGALGVGGLLAGILAASGGNSAPKTGGLALSFK